MSFFVGAGLWGLIAFALGVWSNEADRKWQKALTARGIMPEGPDDVLTGAQHPRSFFRRRRAYLALSYPRALRTDDVGAETWRLLRARRRRLVFIWMFGGLIFAFAVIAIVDAAEANAWWIAMLIPVLSLLVYLARVAYIYGNTSGRS